MFFPSRKFFIILAYVCFAWTSCATWRAPDESADLPLMHPAYETDKHKKARNSTNTETFKSGKKPDRYMDSYDNYGDDKDGWGSYYKKKN